MATMTQDGGSWGYSVPVNDAVANSRSHPPYSNPTHRDQVSPQKQKQNQTPNQPPNNVPVKVVEKRSSARDLRNDGRTATKKRSKTSLREKAEPVRQTSDYTDDSAWIHRDKLAQIEIQEMAEAGIYVRPSRRSQSLGPRREGSRASRSASRSRPRKSTNEHAPDVGYDDDYAAAYPTYPEFDHDHFHTARVASPITLTHEDDQGYDAGRESDSRTEERASEHQYMKNSQPPNPSTGRPGTSRIPVSRNPAVPVPQNVVGRDSPLPRSRAASQSVSNSWDELQYVRKARSGSVSSQLLLDSDPEGPRLLSSNENSPPRARGPKSTAAGRKTSIPSAASSGVGSASANKRVVSGSASRRPGSSSGHRQRPSTGHYSPEGDPPWMASMYKPDPRTPPDEQILPTHAKRMMQEQWEKEGKTGTVYDKHFNLLNDDDLRPKAPVLSPPDRAAKSPSPNRLSRNLSTGSHGIPLSPKSDAGRSDGGARPGTSGGYRITPTITSTPVMPRTSVMSPVSPTAADAATLPTTKPSETDEKQEPEPKSGCCCVVM